MLVGRESERSTVDALLQSARDERSAALVLRGEPGHRQDRAARVRRRPAPRDMTVLRCVGIEAEHELPFAGHAPARAALPGARRPPARPPGRGAARRAGPELRRRFRTASWSPPGCSACSPRPATSGPVLCCVDDAQWLDPPSAEALVFAARRFQAEPIALLMAARDGDARRFDAPGLAELEVGGLDEQHAHALLSARLDRAGGRRTSSSACCGPPTATRSRCSSCPRRSARPSSTASSRSSARRRCAARSRPRSARAWPSLPDAAAPPAPARGRRRGRRPRHGAARRRGARPRALRPRRRRARGPRARRRRGELPPSARALRGLPRGDAQRAPRGPRGAGGRGRRSGERRLAPRASSPSAPTRRSPASSRRPGLQAASRAAPTPRAAAAFERAAELSEDSPRAGRRLRGAAQASLDAGRLDAALALVERARALVADPFELAQLDLIRGRPTPAAAARRPTARAHDARGGRARSPTPRPSWRRRWRCGPCSPACRAGWDERAASTRRRRILERIACDGPHRRLRARRRSTALSRLLRRRRRAGAASASPRRSRNATS